MITPKINFFCIGAQKSSTTTLYDVLKQHPDIFLPLDKEAPFFAWDNWFEKGENWFYKNHFLDYNNQKISGTISPDYLFYPNTAKRIHEHLGTNIKFVIILRNPVDRAVSHYNMTKARLIEKYSFSEAILLEKDRINDDTLKDFNHFSYIQRGKYFEQIKKWFEYFPFENFLIIDFEKDLINNRKQTYKRIFNFLDIVSIEIDENAHSNEAWNYRFENFKRYNLQKTILGKFLKKFMTNRLRNILNQKVSDKNKFKLNNKERKEIFNIYFRDDVERLESLLKKDFSHWR